MVDLFDADIPAHNQDLADDQLTVLVVNHRWREILAPLLAPLCNEGFWVGTEAEIQDAVSKANELVQDLYNVESLKVRMTGARVGRQANQAVLTSTTKIIFDDPALNAVNFDTDGFWDISNPEQFLIPAGMGGFYRVIANVKYHAGPLAFVSAEIRGFPTDVIAVEAAMTADVVSFNMLTDVELAAGDKVTVQVRATVNRTAFGGSTANLVMSIYKLDGGLVPTQ